MNFKLNRVLEPGMAFRHEYDYGSTTELQLKVLSIRSGRPRKAAVELMAENVVPEFLCKECGKVAEHICSECQYEDDGGFLCEDCAEEHECGEDMLLPVVNLPRMGVCGYCG
jgi:hypothetical protein